MPEPKESVSTNKTPESASGKVTRKITQVPENLKGIFNLQDKELLEIATPGSQSRMFVYGGSGGGIDFADLRNLLKKECQLDISLNADFPKENAGKARLFNGPESPDQPPTAIPIEKALTGFQKALEREAASQQETQEKDVGQKPKERKSRIDVLEEQINSLEKIVGKKFPELFEKKIEVKPMSETARISRIDILNAKRDKMKKLLQEKFPGAIVESVLPPMVKDRPSRIDILERDLGDIVKWLKEREQAREKTAKQVVPPPTAVTLEKTQKPPLTKAEKANKDYLEYIEHKGDEETDLLEASVKTPEKAFEKEPSGKLTKLGKAQKDYVSATKAWIEANSFYTQAANENKDYSVAKRAADEADDKYYKAYKESGQESHEDFRKTELGGRLGEEQDRCSEALSKAGEAFATASPGKELWEEIERAYKSKKNTAITLGQVRPKWPTASSAESSPLAAKSQMVGIVESGEGEVRKQFERDFLVDHFWNRVRETPDKPVFHIGRRIRFGIYLRPEELKSWKEAKGNMFSKNPFGEKLSKLEKILLPQKEIQEGFAKLLKEHTIEKDGELRTIALQVVCENLVRKHTNLLGGYYVAKHDSRITSDLIEILKLRKDERILKSYPEILNMLLAGRSKEDVLKAI